MKFQVDGSDLEDIDKINDSGKLFAILVDIMSKLRSPEGCMWDRAQNHKTIKRNLIEETYEAVESIESKDHKGVRDDPFFIDAELRSFGQKSVQNKQHGINEVLR